MTSSVLDLQKDIGKCIPVKGVGSIEYVVRVKDVRLCYGRRQWLVEPMTGNGEAWINAKEGC